MYEKEQKESFIKEYMHSKVVAETTLYAIFKKTDVFERKLNKDVSEFTKEEILSMFKEFKAKSVNSLLNYSIILKHYSRWKADSFGGKAFEEIGKSDVIDLIDKGSIILLSEQEIYDIEDQLLNWSDKAIVELLREGIAGPSMKDIYSLSKDNVDFKKKIITTDQAEHRLTDRLAKILPKAFAENEIVSYGDTMKIMQVNGVGRIYKERANARGTYSDDACFRYFYRRIQLFRNYLDIPGLTMKNLQASGLWHYLQLGMKETQLGLREFLKTRNGKKLAKKYGFGDYWVDNICQKFEQYE